MSSIPKAEARLRDFLRVKGMGLRHRPDLKSWEIFRLAGGTTVVVHGSYSDIIERTKQLVAA